MGERSCLCMVTESLPNEESVCSESDMVDRANGVKTSSGGCCSDLEGIVLLILMWRKRRGVIEKIASFSSSEEENFR